MPLLIIDRLRRQKISKNMVDLNNAVNLLDLTFVESSVQQQQITHSAEEHMVYLSN